MTNDISFLSSGIRNMLAAIVLASAPAAVHAVPIVETFESYASGTTITNQLTGLSVVAQNGGNAKIETASSPVVPGQAQGIYNDAPGVFSTGFEFGLIFNFDEIGSSIGAIVDFGTLGSGVMMTAFDGLNGSGNVLGITSTTTETFISVAAAGIKSAIFENVNANDPGSWLLDNLTYEVSKVPEPASLALMAFGLAGLGFVRRKRKTA